MMIFRIFILISVLCTVWCADPKVVIRQTFPETKVVPNRHKTIEVEKDKDCYMACIVDNRPADKKVQWLVQNFDTNTNIPISTDTDTQNAFKYQIDKPAANNWRLRIQNVQLSDQALYICRVQLGGQQNANDSRMISSIQKPQIIDIYTSSDTTVEVGDRVELECAASGIPTPIVTWQLAGQGILPTGGRELTAPKILMEQVDKQHRGKYKCIAKNKAGVDVRNIYLNVKFQPVLSTKNNEVFQAPGYSRELTCEAKGNPVPTDKQVLWSKDGVPLIKSNEKKYLFKNFFGSNYVLIKLTIHDINDNDYGQYRCYAGNSEGDGQSFVVLSRSSYFVSSGPKNPLSGSAAVVSFSLTTFIMLVVTSLLHFC